MDVQPIITFLHTIKNVWQNSNNEEAQTRAQKISTILEKGKFNSQKWESKMKCDPPVELVYMNDTRKTEDPNQQRRGSIPGSISMSTSEDKKRNEGN